jgi:hypothetical protein
LVVSIFLLRELIVGREKVKVFVMLAPREGYLGFIKVFVTVSNGKSLNSIIGRLTLIFLIYKRKLVKTGEKVKRRK